MGQPVVAETDVERVDAARGRLMAIVKTSQVSPFGHPSRVLEAGSGAPVVFLAGVGGLPQWAPFLDTLAKTRRVLAPSLPGFPGAQDFRHLDEYYDWVLATVEIVEQLGHSAFDLVGSSVGGALATEIAALLPKTVRRLVLISPFGMFDDADPPADLWAQPPGPETIPNLVCAEPDKWKALWQKPPDVDPVEWGILLTRSMEAAARFLFPMGNTRIEKRLHRIVAPTLLVRGNADKVMPASYLPRFAQGIRGPVQTTEVAGAGHLVELDAPDELARRVNAFLSDQQL
jgi:pimeloyl-ACP methyl ester carboxylesterase